MDFKLKYLKYKNKYLNLKKEYEMIGGLTPAELQAARSRLGRARPPPPPPSRRPGGSAAASGARPIPSPRPRSMNIFDVISNSGSLPELPGVSNSCMWISILHYLRYFGGYPDLTLETVRALGGVSGGEHSNKIFDSKLDFHSDGIERICLHFNIQINVYAIGLNNLLVIQDVFPHPSKRGFGYNPSHILRIASYGNHFQIITKSTQLDFDTASSGVAIHESPKDEKKLVFDKKIEQYIDQNEIEIKLSKYKEIIKGKTGVERDSIQDEINRLQKISDRIKDIVSSNASVNTEILSDLNKRKKQLEIEIEKSTNFYQELLSGGEYKKEDQIIVEIISRMESDKKELESLKINIGI